MDRRYPGSGGCSSRRAASNAFHLEASLLTGQFSAVQSGSPYKGGKYAVDIIFPADYPFKGELPYILLVWWLPR